VFGGLSPMFTPVHTYVEDITSTPAPAAPAYQISSAFGVFFRISDMVSEPTLGGPRLFPPFLFSITLSFPTISSPPIP